MGGRSYVCLAMYSEMYHGVDLQGPCDILLLITIAGDGIGYRRALGFEILKCCGCRRSVMIAKRSARYLW